jgi:hypothetical protein
VKLTATPSGGTGTCTVQWQSSPTENGTYQDITNATGNEYVVPTANVGTTWYRAKFSCTGGGCDAAYSEDKQFVTVVADPRITTSAGGDYCVNDVATLTATPSGGTGTCTVQWQSSSTQNGQYNDIPDETGNSFTIPTGQAGITWYRATFSCSGGGCDATASTPVRVRVNYIPIIACPPTYSATCIQSFLPSVTGSATAFDLLGPVATGYTDGTINYDCSSSSYYFIRTWTATNSCGTASCEQRINVSTRFTEGCYAFTVSTFYDATLNRTTFRWTVDAKNCASALSNILFEVPTASSQNCRISSRVPYPILYNPIGNYTGGLTGTQYRVIYPQTEGKGKAAFTGIKFEVISGEGIKNNQEVFEYTVCGNYPVYAGRVAVKAGNNTVTETVDPDCVCKSNGAQGAVNYTTMLGLGLTPSEPVDNKATSAEMNSLSLKSRVYPNPHNGIFNVQFTAIADGAATVEVYTMDGKRVQQKALQVRKGTQQTVPFTVPGKSSLIYRVVNGGQSSSGRILPN